MFNHSLIILPTYNEALNIQLMIDKLFELYPKVSILVIDDNSPDKTSDLVETIKNKHPNLFLITRSGKLGLGTAYLEGFQWALSKKFEFIFQMDCDFSHDPKDLRNLMDDIINQNAHLAIGSRYSNNQVRTNGWSLHRLLLSTFAAFTLRAITGLKIRDSLGGFKCFKRDALLGINLSNIISKGFVFQFEINYKVSSKGFKIIETPIIFSERIMGVSKMNINIIFEAIVVILKLRLLKISGRD